MSFIEKRLLDKVSFGSQSGLEFKTDIKQMRSGFEARLSEWSEPLRPINVVFRLLGPEDRAQLEDAFLVCKGRLTGFRFRDPLNYRVTETVIGQGTGLEQVLQLQRTSRFLQSASYPIKKPVQGTVVIKVNGVATAADIDYRTGKVSITAPDKSVITWSGEYDTPVRFDSDKLQWSYNTKTTDPCSGGEVIRATTDVGLQEIRL